MEFEGSANPDEDLQWLQDFVERSQEYLWLSEEGLIDLEQGNDQAIDGILRSIVSIRTEAEMLALEEISQVSRHLARFLKIIRDQHLRINAEINALLLQLLDVLANLLEQSLTSPRLADAYLQQTQFNLHKLLPALEASLGFLVQPIQNFSEIQQIFPWNDAAQRAAADYGKQVQTTIGGADVAVPQVILRRLPRLLTHLINNAIAHGIELPEERQQRGKDPVGRLALTASVKEPWLWITFEDDGAGIAVDRVKAKAIDKGLISQTEATALTDAQVYEFLFHPDFSTKDIRDMVLPNVKTEKE